MAKTSVSRNSKPCNYIKSIFPLSESISARGSDCSKKQLTCSYTSAPRVIIRVIMINVDARIFKSIDLILYFFLTPARSKPRACVIRTPARIHKYRR